MELHSPPMRFASLRNAIRLFPMGCAESRNKEKGISSPFAEDEGRITPGGFGNAKRDNRTPLGCWSKPTNPPADAISGMQANHPADPENQSDILTLPQIKPRISLPLKGNPDSLPK